MDTSQWPQEVGMVKPMEESNTKPMILERKVRPQKDQALNCPRCNSTNTKFCYYNNYSLTQPRYFCKTCRRYWTEGGSLRNIPVGGGSRKNKRSTPSSSSATSTASSSHKLLPDLNPPSLSKFSSQNPNNIHQGQDLNLAFPSAMQDYLSISQLVDFPKIQTNNNNQPNSSSSSSSTTSLSALELLRTGIASRAMNSFMTTPMPTDSNALYNTSGFPNLQDLKPNLGFSVEGIGSRYGVDQESGNTGRLMFPFGVLKQATSSDQVDQNKGLQGNSSGYWNGMLGGGSW